MAKKQQPAPRSGYILRNAEGNYLSRKMTWYSHNKPEDAFVWPQGSLETLMLASSEWDLKPTKFIPAVYIPEHTMIVPEQTKIGTNEIDVSGLNPLDAIKKINRALEMFSDLPRIDGRDK